MSYRHLLPALILIAAISPFVNAAPAKLRTVSDDDQPDIQTLLRDLHASIEDGKASYESIRIVSQISRLGPQATPAVDILIELLGKPFDDCDEQLRVCPNNAAHCLYESKICPGAEIRKYDYLTPYASAALKQIGVAALPKLSVAVVEEGLSEESFNRRSVAAEIMASIGPPAIPFLSDTLRHSDYSKKRLALEALHTILANDPSSGNQLTSFVPYITPFLDGNFETIDQAIDVLGAIGPGAAEAVPRLTELLSYNRVLGHMACPVGERTGYIFQSKAVDALTKIGTPEALKAVEQIKVSSSDQFR